MIGRFKAVVFDLDGTLADSAPDIAAALNIALHQFGYPSLPLETITRMVGGGARLLAERGLEASGETATSSRADELYSSFHAAYGACPARLTTLYPGARDVLNELNNGAIGLGICTNKPVGLTLPILDALEIAPLFQSVVAAGPDLDLKPSPAMLRKCLCDLGVETRSAVMIGDSAADVGSARAAGVAVILVNHGYTAIPASELGADAVVQGFDELIPALARLM